jgi:TnpA family transposase
MRLKASIFQRRGEIRDRTFENQSFRASGFSLITAAIAHWNTVYLGRAVRSCGRRASRFPMTSWRMSLRSAGSTLP